MRTASGLLMTPYHNNILDEVYAYCQYRSIQTATYMSTHSSYSLKKRLANKRHTNPLALKMFFVLLTKAFTK